MRIAWSGQHTRGKALNILIRAMALVKADASCQEGIAIDVLGAGEKTGDWKILAKTLGIGQCFTWHGWLDKETAKAIVSRCDAFVITSVKDLTSTVLLEALSIGKPVVCLGHCGFVDVVDATCGIVIPIGSPDAVINGFASAIQRLQDAGLRAKLSKGALAKASEYTWNRHGEKLRSIYGEGGKKALVSVYACSPYRGSEPGMGWSYLKIIAEQNEVWAIVEQEKWQCDIEKYLSEHPDEMRNVHWIFIRKPRARLLRKIWPPSYYWFYRIWQCRAYKKALELNAMHHFDIAHQLNMVGFREPGYLWKLPVRFVWGPVGGLGYTDWRLFGLLDVGGKIEFFFRNAINWQHAHCLLRPRRAARKAASGGGLIAATGENQREMKKLWGVDSTVICEIGI